MLEALLVGLVALQQPQIDSVRALQEAKQLVAAYYREMPRTGSGPACTGESLSECMQGDWSCPDDMCRHPAAVTRTLASRLDELARDAGSAEWLFRQRVAFAIRLGELERARGIADSCSDSNAWCMLLRGLTRHLLDTGAGHVEFDSAIAMLTRVPRYLPDGTMARGSGPHARCHWADIRAVVPVELIGDAAATPCEESGALRERFWWLSDPLWSRAGNERLTQHFARQVMLRMHLDVRALPDVPEQLAIDEVMLDAVNPHTAFPHVMRQGFPNSRALNTTGWQKVEGRDDLAVMRSRSFAFVNGGYSFAPDAARLHDPMAGSAEEWRVQWHGEPGCSEPWDVVACGAERSFPRERFHQLEHQAAFFRRGAQLLVVVAAQLPPELSSDAGVAFVLGDVDDLFLRGFPAAVHGDDVLRSFARVDSARFLASLEAGANGHAARARFPVQMPALTNGFGISSLAVVDPRLEDDSLTVEEALLPHTRAPQDSAIGLYFEVYGAADADLELTLSAERLDVSLLDRALRTLRLQQPPVPVRTSWQDSGAAGRFIRLDTRSFETGKYRLTVTVRSLDGGQTAATAQVEIR